MSLFDAYAVLTYNAFEWAGLPPKLPIPIGDLDTI